MSCRCCTYPPFDRDAVENTRTVWSLVVPKGGTWSAPFPRGRWLLQATCYTRSGHHVDRRNANESARAAGALGNSGHSGTIWLSHANPSWLPIGCRSRAPIGLGHHMNATLKRRRRRPYRQTARAVAAEKTAQCIAEAFWTCISEHWFDEVTLEEVAERAGVTVRTILRRFGGKDGLAADFIKYVAPQIAARRTARPGDVEGAIDLLVKFYEEMGDGFIRMAAQESRQPALRSLLETGRERHRQITASTFARWLEPLQRREAQRALDALVIVTDVYTWKLLRREMGRSVGETRAAILDLVQAILDRCVASRGVHTGSGLDGTLIGDDRT